MFGIKDFLTGCLIIFLCLVLVPIFFFVCKLSLIIAIPLAIIIGVIAAIAFLGKAIKYIFSKSP